MDCIRAAAGGALVCLTFAGTVAGEDVYLEVGDSEDSAFSSVFSGEHWSDRLEPSPGKSYYVGADKVIVLADSSSAGTFKGDCLVVEGGVYARAATSYTMTWPDLRMLGGSRYRWENPSVLNGRVTVSGRVAFVAPWRTDGRPFLGADFLSGPDGFLTLSRSSVSDGGSAWHATGDWSGFTGTLCLSNGVQFVPSVSVFSLGGTVRVESGAYLKNSSQNNASITFGGLEMSDGSTLQMKMYGSNGISPITITNSLSFGGDVTLSYFNNAPVYGYEVGSAKKLHAFSLSAEAAARGHDLSGVSVPDLKDSLRIGPFPRLRHLSAEADAQTGGEKIYIKYEDDNSAIHYMSVANASTDASQSAFVSADYWRDGFAGQPSMDSVGDLYAGQNILFHASNALFYEFPGLEFTIGPGRTVYLQTESVQFGAWHFTPGSALLAYTGGYGKEMRGPVRIYSWDGSDGVTFRTWQYCTVDVLGGISGTGELTLSCGTSGGQSSIGGFGLYGDNSGFGGDFVFSAPVSTNTWDAASGAWKDTQFPKLDVGRYLTVSVTNGNAFGGTYVGSAAWKSLLVGSYTLIDAGDDVSFDEPTRGMAVMWGGQLRVAQGKTFRIGVPLTLAGEIRKLGAGTLELAGEARFIDGRSSTEPAAGTNALYVADGAVRIAATNAADGIAMTFAQGARLVVDPDEDADGMSVYGFMATRWPTPLVSESEDGKIAVEVSGEIPAQGVTVPICTVTAAAAETVAFRLPRRARCRAYVDERRNSDGTVTFVARYEPQGMVITFH